MPPPPVPTLAPTTIPTQAPTDLPVATCRVALTGGFGHLWRSNAALRSAIGCPIELERAGYSVEQVYERGLMYWREEGDLYWVMSGGASGEWRPYGNLSLNDPEPSDEPPPNLIRPISGFGRLWQKYPSVRESLGWATTFEVPFSGVIQRFESGTLLFAPAVNGHGRRIYALYNNGTFAIFRDEYTGP